MSKINLTVESPQKNISVELLKYPTEEDWDMVRTFSMNTVGKYAVGATTPNSKSLKIKYLRSEHSPIRHLRFIFRMMIPYCDSVCFTRHHIGAEHYVQSQRDDRCSNALVSRYDKPQGSTVSHMMEINAQELMYMARKRLCHKASENCRLIMNMICELVIKTNPEFEEFLVPNCLYLNNCPEFKSCGFFRAHNDRANGQTPIAEKT